MEVFFKMNSRKISAALWLLAVLLGSSAAVAQSDDSLVFVSAPWGVRQLDRKVSLHQYHFNRKELFASNEFISYIKVKKGRINRFHLAADPKKLKTVADFAEENKAMAAINGNFFNVRDGGAVDFTKVDGTVVNQNSTSSDGSLGAHQKAAIVIDRGRLNIRKWDGQNNWEARLKEPDVLLNGPLLLLDRASEILDSNSFNTTRHPRTCVGITKEGAVILLVVDGRHPNSAGMNLFELTKIMRWLGCVSVLNFDGGGSSTLWVQRDGVINHPTDNRKWDHEGVRKVANILYVKKRK